MKSAVILFMTWTLAFGVVAQGARPAESPEGNSSESGALTTKPPLRLRVDPRIELVSLIFRLAGNPEYNQPRVASYSDEVAHHFDPYKNHPCVKLARDLRRSQGVSYDACMGLAVVLTNAFKPSLNINLKPWPEFLDRRWTVESVTNFVALLARFVQDTSFQQFAEQHAELFRLTAERLQQLLDKESHLEWFQSFFGERPQASFTLIPALLNGGSCYGPHCSDAAGREELFCILGVWETDNQGLPSFNRGMLSTVIHEFCHSYANIIIDQHAAELESAGQKLYAGVAGPMRAQAYGNAQTMLRESLVRGCVVRYVAKYDGPVAARHAIAGEIDRSFSWMSGLSELLGQYEAQRDLYPTLEAFSPRLVKFFDDYAAKFEHEKEDLAAKRPKVVSLVPANGCQTVDPALINIQVVFDRPMRDQCWSMVGGGPHFPETVGQPHYNAQRTTWTAPVKLKPDWTYEFWLNAGQYNAFQSEEGVALESVPVHFKTAREH